MFDLLTLDDLYELHIRLCAQEHAIHDRLMDGQVAKVSPLSDEWAYQQARVAEIGETADAAYAEIQRRELTSLDGCTCQPVGVSHRAGCAWAMSR